jgi:hypothetical protein
MGSFLILLQFYKRCGSSSLDIIYVTNVAPVVPDCPRLQVHLRRRFLVVARHRPLLGLAHRRSHRHPGPQDFSLPPRAALLDHRCSDCFLRGGRHAARLPLHPRQVGRVAPHQEGTLHRR